MLTKHKFIVDPTQYGNVQIEPMSKEQLQVIVAVMTLEMARVHRAMLKAGVEVEFITPITETSTMAAVAVPLAKVEDLYGFKAVGERVVAKGESNVPLETSMKAFGIIDAKIEKFELEAVKLGDEVKAKWQMVVNQKDGEACPCPVCVTEREGSAKSPTHPAPTSPQ